ncbi:V-set and immunoglobulin domain-containing protein 8a isoform X2 [Megalobrama amblycephala]|nr:V-set and immunoglobulin domain-containing protein 8a isoform X2 [Megalobrama amblycephala]XP_048032334.1 V-set and immunoglobulin domain-containing protein 8a isoform X2 [Megalobrama amblycephala]XP_048032343.1 V-set and immunoglobulin domain-containing protein 8a isoform X2 [Megalobrama amblycephala]
MFLKNFSQLNGRKWHKKGCSNMNVQNLCCNTRCLKQMSCVRRTSLSPLSSFMILTVLAVFLKTNVTGAMKVTSSGPQTMQMAQGEPVTLDCTYTSSSADIGELDIEWSVVSPDTTKKDQMIISYTGGRRYTHGDPALMEGVDFTAVDPSQGDASLSITSLMVSHAGTYQCKVKKTPGVDSRKILLIVMVSPSVPKCWVDGGEAVGEAASLRCRSDQGSTPLLYSWRRESGGPIPPDAIQNSLTGELLISNHSLSHSGVYSCEVSNAVGKKSCRLNLQAVKPPNRAGVITGTVVGCLLLIMIVLLIIWLLVFRCNWNRQEKEFSNEIREDALAPESRPTSRISSFRSGVAYSQVGQNQTEHPPSTNTSYSTAKYDSRFGYAV